VDEATIIAGLKGIGVLPQDAHCHAYYYDGPELGVFLVVKAEDSAELPQVEEGQPWPKRRAVAGCPQGDEPCH